MYQLMTLVNVLFAWTLIACRFLLYFWFILILYNIVSAALGLFVLRRYYLNILRATYRLFGFTRATYSRQKKVRFHEDLVSSEPNKSSMPRCRSLRQFKGEFRLADACDYVHDGIEVLVEDDVTKCFSTEELEEWNFLNRTRVNQSNVGLRMELLLALSIIFRFSIFFVIRLPIGIASLLWLFGTMTVLSVLGLFAPKAHWKRRLERYCSMVCCRLLAAAFTAVVNIHHRENRATLGSVCVANHTTPIDIIMLAVDNCFTLVGQRHGGILGLIQTACSLAQEHIWFERKIASDRKMVSNRLKEHIEDGFNNPILIFPEGTCINNTSVFMFKKGCFELGATIHPVVIKYHREFAEPYWNSQEQGMLTYLLMIMTSWAIVCDVDYLEPTSLKNGETAIEFAQRVKADICRRGGLVDLPWDGMIKRPGNEDYLAKVMEEERQAYIKVLKVYPPSNPLSNAPAGIMMIPHHENDSSEHQTLGGDHEVRPRKVEDSDNDEEDADSGLIMGSLRPASKPHED